MPPVRNRIVFLLAFILVGLAAGPVPAVMPMQYTLPNGLEVILLENHRAPVVSMLVWIKAGSAVEQEGEYGLAHLMEHMVFKGTPTRGPGEIPREIEGAGGQTNAYTSFDQTVYYIDMAGRFMDRGLDVLADMVFNPALDPVEFEREKEVVIEEINRGMDIPAQRLSKALFQTAYLVHPYGRPVIGFSESVRAMTPENARAFHQRWYRPGNAILVVAGDFETSAIRKMIAENFGSIPAGDVIEDHRPVEPPQFQARAFVLNGDVQTARLDLAFHIPSVNHPDTKALDLLAVILGEGRTARFYQQIKRKKEIVNEIYASAYTPRDPGLFFIDAALATEQVPAAIQAVLDEIDQTAREPVDPDELARARLKIKAEFIRSRATMSGEARVAANFQAF